MPQSSTWITLGAIALVSLTSCAKPPEASLNSPQSNQAGTTPAAQAAQGAIKVGSSSSSTDLIKTLQADYGKSSPTTTLQLLEPSQSENILAGLRQNLVDVGAISKTLKPTEKEGIEAQEIAKDALLIALHPSVTGVTNLTTDQLKGIYSGQITNWKAVGGPDATIVLLDRPEDESAKRLLRQHYLGADLPNAPSAVVLRKEGELIQTLQSTPHSMGAFSLAYAIARQLPVTRLSLDGIEPSIASLKTGQYPMSRTISLVWGQQANSTTQAFIRYVASPSASQVIEQAGFMPIAATAANQGQPGQPSPTSVSQGQ
jgi:phosphate transport system substrate-binding protein